MGTKNNVNPNHYKTAGRERQGDDIVQEIHKQEFAQSKASAGKENFIPGAAPVGESEPSNEQTGGKSHEDTRRDVGQTNESANSSSHT